MPSVLPEAVAVANTACLESTMRFPTAFLTFYAACVLLVSPAWSYLDPVDTAGPITARIVAPETVTATEAPQAVKVIVENKGSAAVAGTVELGLVDRWRAEPAQAVPFQVAAGASTTLDFQVTAGDGSYSEVHYPIHAWVRFPSEGATLVAHPIFILQTKFATDFARPVPEWKPLRLDADRELGLIGLPVHRSVVQPFNQPAKTMPVGWQGSEETSSGSTAIRSESIGGQSRRVIGIHPPWRDGRVGTQWIEFPLVLPDVQPIKLRFGHAMTPTGESDGVTFRVRVAPLDAPEGTPGEVAFERHSAAKEWTPAEADLSRFAGQSVRLQLESHPGPKNNTGWDQSFWAEPVVVAGRPPALAPFPPADDAGSRLLGKAGDYEVRVWPGSRGLLDAAVEFRSGQERLAFRGFRVEAADARIDDAASPVLLREVKEEPVDGTGVAFRHRFECSLGAFDVVARLNVKEGALRARFALENAPPPKPWQVVWLQGVAAGPWSKQAKRVYGGPGNVMQDPAAFQLSFDGHRLATSFVGFEFPGVALVQASDLPPNHLEVAPADKVYTLEVPHAPTLSFFPVASVWEGARLYRETNGLKPAGGVPGAAGRFVFDLWGGRYAESAKELERSFRYGLTDSMVVWHNWQRWGYDYRLPEIYPPNPQLGTLEEMQALADTCKKAGVVFAPHDNYIDYYPDAEGFSYDRMIAFRGPGQPVRAWFNKGREAQSYRYRADVCTEPLQANVAKIREGLAPTGYFIDVWSSAGPYDYWTADGRFADRIGTRNTWGEAFAWIRDTLGGNAPQISESGHDQLIGWLDGAQTNHLRVGKPVPGDYHSWSVWNIDCGDAERVPWFDAAHHDRFILHGAGYSGRYQAGLAANMHGIYSDDYVCTEVLTGHPAMVPSPFGRDVVRKYWLLHALGRALALRTIEDVEFAEGDLHRQHVRWSGGGETWVNRGEDDWNIGPVVLPPYGFYARVQTEQGLVEAAIARRDGVIAEWSREPGVLYVNGRQPADGPLPIRLAVKKFTDLGGGKFELALAWQADAPIPAGYRPFFHVGTAENDILFQASHQPGQFDEPRSGRFEAKAAGTVPAEVAAGTKLDVVFGLYQPGGGERLELAGPDRGDRRIRLGTLSVARQAGGVQLGWKDYEGGADPFQSRQNLEGRPVAFGQVITPSGVRLTREGDVLVATLLPGRRRPAFELRLGARALPWTTTGPVRVEEIDEQGAVTRQFELTPTEQGIVLPCSPDAMAYRLSRPSAR